MFFDDILVFSKKMQDHVNHLKLTIDILRQNKLLVKKSKCEFGKAELEYLRHIISKD